MSAVLLLVLLPAAAGVTLVLLGPRVDRPASALGAVATVATLGVLLGTGRTPEVAYPFLLGLPWRLGVDGLSLACLLYTSPSPRDS